MFWRRKRKPFDKRNFEYWVNSRNITMSKGVLLIDGDIFSSQDYPATYDLAIALACIMYDRGY